MKFATRTGIVSYVGKVVAPGDWDNIIRNVIFRGRERGNHFTIFTNPAISDVRSANKLAKLPVPNTRMTARTYSKIEVEFDYLLYTNLVEVVPHH